jgi:DNA-binding MarR family transcriptional regulator
MESDAVASLGYLALGTRLKRLAEQLQAGVAEAMTDSGEAVPPGQLPLLAVISDAGGMTVAQLVEAIGMSQPGISRMLGTLQRSGLVKLKVDADDARVRRAEITPKGRQALERIRERIFPKVAAAAEQLCDGLDLLDALGTIEQRNSEIPFSRRIREAKP